MISLVEGNFDDKNREGAPGRLLRQLFEQAPDALMVVDESDRIILMNVRAEQMFKCRSRQLAGQSPVCLLPEWFQKVSSIKDEVAAKATGNVSNMTGLRFGGESFGAEVSVSTLILTNRRLVVAGIRDTTANSIARRALETINKELVETNTHLVSLSNTDPLTELLNRRGLETVLKREVSYSRRHRSELLAILVDLDDFKIVNDTNGHATGDRVLKQVARTLKESLRTVDWIGRVGGDEFLILLPSTPLPVGIQVAERVRLALCQKTISDLSNQTHVTASLGLVCLPTNVASIEEVMEFTTAALKESKYKGKNRVSFGDDVEKTVEPENGGLTGLLNGDDQCRVISQPIRLLMNEEISGYEMFSRGPAGPLEKPIELFKVSVENDKLTVVDLICLKLCLKHAASMPESVTKSINLFPSTLIDVPTHKLVELIDSYGITGKICLEFSERMLVTDPGSLKRQMRDLRAGGISICLDDIGYGCSSMESLVLLEPESIKIDGKCIRGVAQDSERRKYLRKLANLAKSIGIKTIAEGIETREDFRVVRDLGLDYGQGWLWGYPA